MTFVALLMVSNANATTFTGQYEGGKSFFSEISEISKPVYTPDLLSSFMNKLANEYNLSPITHTYFIKVD
jgi:hypothetical protein